ncbi:hypothetical protein A7A78_07725 [Aequorivita soesokkakensis]|jgi:cell wall-associated NlpC family hydrolase|uniref:NlpC/P60 domain-containing protein n=1 Tax=Aequorivita soesokkakensis TaxID=1385699 RepID=A0A1A9LAK4_9FLAO|nr:C40 family peptidase [Aequorivita soesokkakensis]OAD90097.1 hypothetical protein A7A78_07725 [Aequorivita soesokkakensis]
MKKILFFTLFAFFLVSCGSTKNTGKVPEAIIGKETPKTQNTKKERTKSNKQVIAKEEEPEKEDAKDVRETIIDYAKSFQGTRYKFGGTTSAGMDCSGLVYTAFQKENITLPRISRDMAKKGILVSFKDIEKGDLVFFKTSSRNAITHVGLVVEAKRGEVKFIHSTTQAGVIISSLDEAYWKKAFVEVRRII